MGTQEITAARYYQGVAETAQRRPHAVHRLRHHLVGEAGRQRSRTCLTSPPTRPRPGRCGRPARRRSTSASRRARAAPRSVPGANLKTILELAQKRGHEGRQRLHRGDHRRDAGGAGRPHLAARLPGPGQHGRLPAETKAAGGLGSIAEQEIDHKVDVLLGGGRGRFTQTITGGPDSRQNGGRRSAQERGYRYVTDADGLSTVAERQQTGARPLQHQQHVAGVERPGRDDRQGQRAGRLHRGPARRATSRAWRR